MKLRNKKTGKIVELDHISIHYNRPEEWGQQPCSTWDHSLAELNEEWEDHKPAEPLIKDEKIRKAVRAWADGNNIESVHYDAFWRGFRRKNSSITVWEELPLEDNEVYTIAELCGEEEECEPDAREKLEAWKRLKDKGFRFNGVEVFSKGLLEIDAVLPAIENADNAERLKMLDDLWLLFPEEEDFGGKDVRRQNPLAELSPYDYSKRNIVTDHTEPCGGSKE